MNRYLKFGIPVAAILATLAWLAVIGAKESAGYFKEIPEVKAMGDAARTTHLRVNGYVKEGSIVHEGHATTFTLVEHEGTSNSGDQMQVVYNGEDPLPDTFKDHAQALADGSLAADGTFHASKIQAKCASKYEGAPPPSAAAASKSTI